MQCSSMGQPSAIAVLASLAAGISVFATSTVSARQVAVEANLQQDVQIFGIDVLDSSVASLSNDKVRMSTLPFSI
jgi:methylmalonyl-CoA mutase cobalamin-binding subunit